MVTKSIHAQGRKYGWKKDSIDKRDFKFSAPLHLVSTLPPSIDLSDKWKTVYDQSTLGSCSANAIGGGFEYDLIAQNLVDFMPSRLFIYYNERAAEGTINEDSGAMIRDGIKSLNVQGVCPESMWPYKINRFRQKPTDDCYTEALNHTSVLYQRVGQTLNEIKTTLASGFPIVFGFMVYESFESEIVAETGMMSMPKEGERCLGGHAVICCGFDDKKQCFKIRNSWGEAWGDKGYFWMPYDYLTHSQLSSDLWVITSINSKTPKEVVKDDKQSFWSKIYKFISSLFKR